jgi:stalled ribosome rescue protein Dom34
MNPPFHMVVWLDQRNARVFGLAGHAAHKTKVDAPDTGKGHIHHHAGTPGSGHNEMDKTFLEKISSVIGDAQEILLLGPAQAKGALKSFLNEHKPRQAAHVMSVEAMGHASDEEIIATARRFFLMADKMVAR